MYNFLSAHKKTIVYLLSFYWLLLLFLTSIPGNSVPSVGLTDKSEHFLGYFGLAFLLNLVLLVQDKFPLLKKYNVLFTFLFGALYGIFDEVHQKLVPGRVCDFWDWTADVIGLAIGILTVLLVSYVFSLLSKKKI